MTNLYIDTIESKLNVKKRPPIWLMRQAGRYMPEYLKIRKQHLFKTCIYTPKLVEKITLLPIKAFQTDAAILFSDILVIIDALNLDLIYKEKQGPIVTNPIRNPEDVNRLKSIHKQQIFSPIYEGISACLAALNKYQTPLIGFAGAPFTIASYMIEGKSIKHLEQTKQFYYTHETAFKDLINLLEDIIYEFLMGQIKAGVHALQLFDTWANLLPYQQFRNYCINPIKNIITKIRQNSNIPITVFCKSSSLHFQDLLETNCSVIGIDWQGNLSNILSQTPEKVAIQGNLDPLLLFASKNVIKNELETLLKQTKNRKNFVVNLGHGLFPNTPYDNVRYLISLVKNHKVFN